VWDKRTELAAKQSLLPFDDTRLIYLFGNLGCCEYL